MNTSMKNPFIEVMCRPTDAHIFKKLGFIAEPGRIDTGIRMVNRDPPREDAFPDINGSGIQRRL